MLKLPTEFPSGDSMSLVVSTTGSYCALAAVMAASGRSVLSGTLGFPTRGLVGQELVALKMKKIHFLSSLVEGVY